MKAAVKLAIDNAPVVERGVILSQDGAKLERRGWSRVGQYTQNGWRRSTIWIHPDHPGMHKQEEACKIERDAWKARTQQ